MINDINLITRILIPLIILGHTFVMRAQIGQNIFDWVTISLHENNMYFHNNWIMAHKRFVKWVANILLRRIFMMEILLLIRRSWYSNWVAVHQAMWPLRFERPTLQTGADFHVVVIVDLPGHTKVRFIHDGDAHYRTILSNIKTCYQDFAKGLVYEILIQNHVKYALPLLVKMIQTCHDLNMQRQPWRVDLRPEWLIRKKKS